MIGIYKITNTITNEVYIGQTIDLKRRSNEHFSLLRRGLHYNKHLQASFNKYKEFAFEFEIVEVVTDRELLNDLEIYYIKLYNSLKCGYNQTSGGDSGTLKTGECHYRYKNELYTFYHTSGIVEYNITCYNLITKYNLDSAAVSRLISGRYKRTNGWALTPEECIKREPIYLWIHKSGVQLECTATELYNKYNKCTNFYHIIRQKPLQCSCKGWKYIKQL